MLTERIKGYLKLLCSLSIFKTLYFNFKVFPWNIAKKLPVYFFGPVTFASLKGKVILDVRKVSRGMVQFGCKSENIFSTKEPTRISVEGELIFKGSSRYGHAVHLLVWNNARLIIGNNCWIGSFTRMVAFRSIVIENNFLASWECQLFDTNFHFIEDTGNGTIADPNGTILVKENVWLGNRVTVLKNTLIPENCIIAAGSVCNKDYSSTSKPGSVIGGIPAKFIKENVKYLNNKQLEIKLFKHFQQPENFNTSVEKRDCGK